MLDACECDDGKPIWRPDRPIDNGLSLFNEYLEQMLQDLNRRKDYSASTEGNDVEWLWKQIVELKKAMIERGYTFPEDRPDIFARPDGSEGSVR